MDIQTRLMRVSGHVSEKTVKHAETLFTEYGNEQYFGRSCVELITGLKPSGASKLLKRLLECGIIDPITGHEKGKDRFV